MNIFFFADSIRGQIQTQNDLDDIVKNLRIKVEVVDNLKFNGSKHLFRVTFDNKGYVSLSGTNWKIFLYSFFVIEADHILSGDGNFMLSEGYVLKEFNMSTRQIQGSLYSLTPVSGFPEILPNSTRDLTFYAANWAVSKSDIPPNWFIVADGLVPRVLESTMVDFVEDFTTPNQWKRTKYDLYNPYTPLERYNRYKTTNPHVQTKLVIPTPKILITKYNMPNLDVSSDVYIVHNSLLNEAHYLASK